MIIRGSLLVWLDDFLAQPQTPLDRTLGRWDNAIDAEYASSAVPEVDGLRRRIHFKAFALNDADTNMPGNPQKHGDFSAQAFWDPNFWRITDPRPVNNRATQSIHDRAQELAE